jgi:serine/threonine-protein kinase
MQPGDTSFPDEITRTLVLDDWTPVVGFDPFDDDHTTSTWRSSPAFGLPERRNIPFLHEHTHEHTQDSFTAWDDVEHSTRRLQSDDATRALGRMPAPRSTRDAASTHMSASNHTARSSELRPSAIVRVAEADAVSARLRARAAAQPQARPGFVVPHAGSAERSASLPVIAQARATQPAQVRVTPRRQTLLGLPGPAQVQARQAQPVAQRAAAVAPRFAPIALTTERVAQRDPWLTPRTQRQLGTMSLLPAVALFGAVFAGRVLLSVGGGPALHPAPITTTPVMPARAETEPHFQAPVAAPTPTESAQKLADVPPASAAPKPAGHVARGAAQHASASTAHAPRRIEQFASPTAPETSDSAPVGEGVLRINSRPWAEIFVDGAPFGNTPQPNLRLPAGAHTIELLNRPMSMNKTLHVVIQPGQTETRVVNLIE